MTGSNVSLGVRGITDGTVVKEMTQYANGFSDSTGDHQVSVHDRCMRGHTSEAGVDSRQIDAPKMLKGCDDCSLGFSPAQPTTAEQNGSDHYVLSQDNNICKPQVSQSYADCGPPCSTQPCSNDLTAAIAELNIPLTDSQETSVLWELVAQSVGLYRHGKFKLPTLRNLSVPTSSSSNMTSVPDDNDFWATVEARFKIAGDSIDRNERKGALLDGQNKEGRHFQGAIKESRNDYEVFKSDLRLILGRGDGTRDYLQDSFFHRTVGIIRVSRRNIFHLSWREIAQFSQNKEGTATAQASEDQKVDSNLVYSIDNQEAGAYITVNFQKNAHKRIQSEIQVLASATTFLRTIYESWYKANSRGSIPPYIKHYGLTFVGENYWAIFEAVPKVDSQGRWPGCTLVQIGHGGYDTYDDYLRLIRKINQIHRWGLIDFANGVLKPGPIVDNSATKAPKADVTSSSTSHAKRSGTSAPQGIDSTKGSSVSKEPDRASQEKSQSAIHPSPNPTPPPPTPSLRPSDIRGPTSSPSNNSPAAIPRPQTPSLRYSSLSSSVPSSTPERFKKAAREIEEGIRKVGGLFQLPPKRGHKIDHDKI